MSSKVIKNGTIVTADLTYKSDVKIENGVITEIGPDLTGDEMLDAIEDLLRMPIFEFEKSDVLQRVLVDGRSHEIDLACWYANEPVTDIQAMDGVYGGIGFTAPDLAQLNLRFGEKCIASVYLNFFGTPRTRITELIGTRGTITVEFCSWDQCTVSVYEAEKGNWEREVIATERDHMFRTEDREFLQAITDNTKTLCPLEEGIKSLKIICTAIADNE